MTMLCTLNQVSTMALMGHPITTIRTNALPVRIVRTTMTVLAEALSEAVVAAVDVVGDRPLAVAGAEVAVVMGGRIRGTSPWMTPAMQTRTRMKTRVATEAEPMP